MDLEQTTIEIIDLCTPTLDNGDRSIVAQVSQDISPFEPLFERFPNHYHRLYILPWFPISDNEDQGHPLLANVPRRRIESISSLYSFLCIF